MTPIETAENLLSCSIEELVEEIRRYLEAVDLFRTLGHEPRWISEQAGAVVALSAPHVDRLGAV